MTPDRAAALLERMAGIRTGVLGDFAVDCYYDLQRDTGEISLETGHQVHRGSGIRTSLGAAGNVLRNIAALGAAKVSVFGLAGSDLWGRELRGLLHREGADTNGLLPWEGETFAYVKPMLSGVEEHRIDFGSENGVDEDSWRRVRDVLVARAGDFGLLLLNQQFPSPLLTPERLNGLSKELDGQATPVVMANPRSGGHRFRGGILQVNESELALLHARAIGGTDLATARQAMRMAGITKGHVLVTRAPQGMLLATPEQVWSELAVPVSGPVDTVGAGDTVMAAFGLAWAAGAEPPEALCLANAAASLSIRQLGCTGVACPAEILEVLRRKETA
jgi:rfaE bifunctional protein kinase chain/domain